MRTALLTMNLPKLKLVAMFVLVGIFVIAAIGPVRGEDARRGSALTWHPCPYDPDKISVVRCGRLSLHGPVPATLPVVLIQVEPSMLSETAVLFLQGGPGSASWLAPEQFGWPQWVRFADLPMDFVAFDQRGTGLGDPSLRCPEYDPLIRPGLSEGWFSDPMADRFMTATAACHDRLVAEGHDLDQFTTRRNAEDVVALMEALPYSSWTLLGTSYGTRLALEVMRLDPPGLRSVVLDGALPPDVRLGLEAPALLDRAIDQVGTACMNPHLDSSQCVAPAGKFELSLGLVLERIAADPHWVRIEPPDSDIYKLRVGPAVLLDSLLSTMVFPDAAAGAREAIFHAAHGKYELLDWYLEGWAHEQIYYDIHDPVFISVLCDLEGDTTQDEMDRRIAESRYFGVFPRDDGFLEVCGYWTTNRVSNSQREPVVSQIPALILSGEYDPLTPSTWGERIARGLGNGHHFVVPRGGHVSVFSNICVMEMMTAFLKDPTVRPDAGCLEESLAGLLKPP